MRPNQAKLVEDFNDNNDVGAAIRYWTGAREGAGVLSKTRSRAQVLSGHTAVVWVEGHGACIALSHIQLVTTPIRALEYDDTPGTLQETGESPEDAVKRIWRY